MSRERTCFNFLLTSLRATDTGASSVLTPWNEYLGDIFFLGGGQSLCKVTSFSIHHLPRKKNGGKSTKNCLFEIENDHTLQLIVNSDLPLVEPARPLSSVSRAVEQPYN